MLQVAKLKFQQNWAVAQEYLLEKLKKNNVSKVSFLKLLTKENLLVCFISLLLNDFQKTFVS